jgi:hypothetical protein
MSLEAPKYFKQLQTWAANPTPFEGLTPSREEVEKIKQVYLECQKELTQLTVAIENKQFEKTTEFVQSNLIMEQFLDSPLAKSVFPFFEHSLEKAQIQLHEQEKSHGLALFPRIAQMSGIEEPVREKCFSLLVTLKDRLAFVLDLLEKNPAFGKGLVEFLSILEKPKAFLKDLIKLYEKKTIDIKAFEAMILDIGFANIFFQYSTFDIPQFVPVYQKDPEFTKKFILINLNEWEQLLKIATHHIPLASKLLAIFSQYSPGLRQACDPLLKQRVWKTSGGMGFMDIDIETIEKIVPFFEWVITKAASGEIEEELIAMIKKANQFLSGNKAIATILLGLPEEKQPLWHKVYAQTSDLKKLTTSDVQRIFAQQKESALFIECFEPWNGKTWITTLCSHPPTTKNLISLWVDKLLPDSSSLPLEEKLPKLSLELRKILVQLCALAQKEPQILEPFFTFAKEYSNEHQLSQMLKLITSFPAQGNSIIQFVLKDIDRLQSLNQWMSKDSRECRKFISLLHDLDPLLLEFILSKGSKQMSQLIALAQSKPQLLAALVEIDGLVNINCIPYLIDALDEESAELLLSNASFRHQLLHQIPGKIIIGSWKNSCPFSLIVQALKHNRTLAMEIVSLTQNHPPLMKQLLEELFVKEKDEKPLYAALLNLKAKAKSGEEIKKVEKLLSLIEDKKPFAIPLLESASTQGFIIFTHLLELSEKHPSLFSEILKKFPDLPLRERILSLASPDTVPLLKALLILDPAKNASFFQKLVEDTTPHSLSPYLQIELLKIFFPSFSPALEAWGQKLFTLYGKGSVPPKGEELFIQLPQQARDILLEWVSLNRQSASNVELFEKFLFHFPYPAFLSRLLQVAESNFGVLSNYLNFVIKYPDCAALFIEALAETSSLSWPHEEDIAAFLFKYAPYLVNNANDLNNFYWSHHPLIHRIVRDPNLSEGEQLREICNATRKTHTSITNSYTALSKKLNTVFSENPTLQQQFNAMIQKGFAKEVSQLLMLYESQKAPKLAQALLTLVAEGNGRLLYACLQIRGSEQGEELLRLFAEKTDPFLNQLIIESAAGHHRFVDYLLPTFKGEKLGDPFFLNLLDQKEGGFAEVILAKKGNYLEEMRTIPSISLQKELFFISQVAPKVVCDFCIAFCKETKDEKTACARLGSIHYLLAHNRSLIETLVTTFSAKEVFEKVDAEIAEAISQLDQKVSQKMADYKGEQKDLVEARTFAVLASELLLTAAGTINYTLLERVKENETAAASYLNHVFQALLSYPEFSIKISSIQAPPALSSPSIQLIQEICDLPPDVPLTDRHAQIAVLSALLSRPRQSDTIGSCFGTSILIQTHSSPEHLLSVLEDYASLITHAKITRTFDKEGMNATYDFPVRQFPKESKKLIEGEHLLVKTLEFLIASMADKAENLIQKNLGHFNSWGIIGLRLWRINYRSVQNHLEIIERATILQAMKEVFLQTVDAIYDPFAQYKGKQASFNLLDREKLLPIYEDNQYRDLLVKVIQKTQQNLEAKFPEKRAIVLRTFSELVPWLSGNVDQEDSFLRSLSNKMGEDGILSLYAEETGSFVPRCRKIYYEELQQHDATHRMVLANNSDDIQTVVKFIESMPQEQKEIYLKNPMRLSPMGITEHAMSFMPGPLLQQLAQGITVDHLTNTWQKQAKQKGEIIPSKDQKSRVIKSFILEMQEKNRVLLEEAIKQSTLLEEHITLEKFANLLLEIAQQVGGFFTTKKNWTEELEGMIFKVIPESKFPTLQIGDFNWNQGDESIYLSFGCSPITQQIRMYATSTNLAYMVPYSTDHFEIYSDTIIPQKGKIW